MGWISVDEQLPDDEERVWCAMRNRKRSDKFVYSDALIYWTGASGIKKGWTRSDCTRLEKHLVVTHWQPLPAPPISERSAGE